MISATGNTAHQAVAAVTWAQQVQAWGSLAAVAVAVGALITTIVLANKARDRAQGQLEDQRAQHAHDRAESARQLHEERARVFAEQVRQHQLRILLDVSEQYARYCGYPHMPQAKEAIERLRVLIRSSRTDTERFSSARSEYRITGFEGGMKTTELYHFTEKGREFIRRWTDAEPLEG